jgi:hypothetical protein
MWVPHKGPNGRGNQVGPIALAAALAVLAGARPAAGTEYCDVLPGPGSLAALRSAPRSSAPLIARMHPGDEVRALDGVRPGWLEVYFWHDHDRLSEATRLQFRHGWVRLRDIGECGRHTVEA